MKKPLVAVVGAGPAGLMAAQTLQEQGAQVQLYDSMPSPARKFLRAGVGGLNLTHSEPSQQFLTRYSHPAILPMLSQFAALEMVAWAQDLGFETFTGTSGRVFPKGLKASPLLRAWLQRLSAGGVTFHPRHRLVDLQGKTLTFSVPGGQAQAEADAVILALGGGSWRKLGSDAAWFALLQAKEIPLAPLKPANCGFNVHWSEHFRTRYDGAPLKAVRLGLGQVWKQGEFIVTAYGVEGSLIYALSAPIRDALESSAPQTVLLDLAPGWTEEKLANRLSQPRGSRSLASHIEKAVGLKGVKTGLLWEFLSREEMENPLMLAKAIKSLPLPLQSPRPLNEAISTAGGIRFEGLDERLMLKKIPGVFCAGEMLDWEAPTGGYLLTGSMSTGRWAALGALAWLRLSSP